MASIVPTTGLISGLQTKELIDALVVAQNNVILRLQNREKTYKSTQLGLTTLSAKLLTLSTSAASLATSTNFSKFKAISSDAAQLSVTASSTAVPGDYRFQVLRLASSQQTLSRGFADATSQTIAAGGGTLTISTGGRLASDTALDALNGGTGVRRGTIRITDRSGAGADIDLSAAATVTDVLDAINSANGISVVAEARGDKLVLRDTTGLTTANLTVADKSGGHAAQDLGIGQSVASNTLNGASVYQAGGNFALSKLNDGNGLRLIAGQPDLRIALTDVAATTLDVDLDGAATLNDVVTRVNSHASNGGKLTAAIAGGKLVLTDNTGGGGSNPLSATSFNGSNAADVLGLSPAAVGNVLTGQRLAAGLNSVLLRNLRGGQGITNVGSLSLTDRAGTTTTINLTGAESLDDVLTAINTAESAGTALKLEASLNAAGNGLVIRDTSGQTASNLIVADVGGSTLAAQLGIAVNAAQTEQQSGALNLRHVNEATLLAKYAPGGVDLRRGTIGIKDSTGVEYFANISTSLKTLGDVIGQISTATAGKVTAHLNETGDGLVLIDQAGGASQIVVRDLDSQAAADLRIVGTGAAGGDGKSRIAGRKSAVITVAATDTLQLLADKLNAAKAGVTATIIDDGTSFAPKRLVLTSKTSGAAGRVVIDEGALGLNLARQSRGQDALLRIGADAATGFLVASSINTFDGAVSGLTLTAKAIGAAPATVTVTRDNDKLAEILSTFVKGYNDSITQIAEATKFNAETGERGALQGEGVALRVSSSLNSLVNGIGFGPAGSSVRTLRSLGIHLKGDGKLEFNSAKFASIAESDPQAVADFFLTATTGFAAKLKATVESFTDPATGMLTAADKSAQESVDNLERRIATVQDLIASRKERLLRQFTQLEQILSGLTSQQTALANLQNLAPQK